MAGEFTSRASFETRENLLKSIPIKKDKRSNTYVKLGAVESLKGNFHSLHNHFVGQFTYEWRLDVNISLLLSAITLFNSERAHVVHRPLVK